METLTKYAYAVLTVLRGNRIGLSPINILKLLKLIIISSIRILLLIVNILADRVLS